MRKTLAALFLLLSGFPVACISALPQTAPIGLEPHSGYTLSTLSYHLIPTNEEPELRFTEADFNSGSFAYIFFLPESDEHGKFAFSADLQPIIGDTLTTQLLFGDFYGRYVITRDTMQLFVTRADGRPPWVIELPDYIRFSGGLILGTRHLLTSEFEFRYLVRYIGNDSLRISLRALEILEEMQ